MKKVFADAVYWIALINPTEQWFRLAHSATENLGEFRLFTTTEVLTETLNFYSEGGHMKRHAASQLIRSILIDSTIQKVEPSQGRFLDGLDMFESRIEKGYSLTDCISMNVCRELSITEVLTHDDHIRQEGLNILL